MSNKFKLFIILLVLFTYACIAFPIILAIMLGLIYLGMLAVALLCCSCKH